MDTTWSLGEGMCQRCGWRGEVFLGRFGQARCPLDFELEQGYPPRPRDDDQQWWERLRAALGLPPLTPAGILMILRCLMLLTVPFTGKSGHCNDCKKDWTFGRSGSVASPPRLGNCSNRLVVRIL